MEFGIIVLIVMVSTSNGDVLAFLYVLHSIKVAQTMPVFALINILFTTNSIMPQTIYRHNNIRNTKYQYMRKRNCCCYEISTITTRNNLK